MNLTRRVLPPVFLGTYHYVGTTAALTLLRKIATRLRLMVASVTPGLVAGPNAQPLVAPWQTLGGDHDALYTLLLETCRRLTITVTLDPDLPEAIKGSSTGKGQIRLRAQEGMGERALTLLHEMAHETLHPSAVREQAGFTRQQVECQAEAVAYCCAQALGMETPNSPTYLALYHIGRDELRKNAQAIAVGVQKILRAVERASEPAAEAAA